MYPTFTVGVLFFVWLAVQKMSKVVTGGVGNPVVSSLEVFCYVTGFFSYVCEFCPFFNRVVLCISNVFCVFRIGVGMVVVRMQYLLYDLFFFLFTMCVSGV